ncbi:MAG: DUF6544 family protein, partial [Caldilineaceae bacterium]
IYPTPNPHEANEEAECQPFPPSLEIGRPTMRFLLIVVLTLVALLFVGWLGLRVPPRPFADAAEAGLAPDTPTFVPLPTGLPAPVERFYRTVYGDQVPVITSAVIDGRGKMAPFGLYLPARFRFVHEAGKGYRHYIEATWFGLPFLRINESYVDGSSSFNVPIVGSAPDNTNLRGAANQGLWSETIWLPALWVTDTRVRWTAVDDNTALLTVPFEPAGGPEGEQTFVVRFDPATGLITWMETLRNRDANVDESILWVNFVTAWSEVDGWRIPTVGEVTWMDQGRPWAYFGVESLNFNADVSSYLRQTGL